MYYLNLIHNNSCCSQYTQYNWEDISFWSFSAQCRCRKELNSDSCNVGAASMIFSSWNASATALRALRGTGTPSRTWSTKYSSKDILKTSCVHMAHYMNTLGLALVWLERRCAHAFWHRKDERNEANQHIEKPINSLADRSPGAACWCIVLMKCLGPTGFHESCSRFTQ